MNSDEFSLFDYSHRVMGLWWLVAICTILGGASGFLFYHLHPPIYEATVTYLVTIDLDRFPIAGMRDDIVQYNEDLALNTTQSILLSKDVLNNVIRQVKSNGIGITGRELLNNYTIERKQEIWELRYRSTNPQEAQDVVNTWANFGYEAMITWKDTGKAPVYVVFQPPTLSLLPQVPVLYDRNKVILAGMLIGFIIGILGTNLLSRPKKSSSLQP